MKMIVEFDVTIPQALALQAMFKEWSYMGNTGMSRHISFFVDGDGNFRPNCKFNFSEKIPELTKELENAAKLKTAPDIYLGYDYDKIAYMIST